MAVSHRTFNSIAMVASPNLHPLPLLNPSFRSHLPRLLKPLPVLRLPLLKPSLNLPLPGFSSRRGLGFLACIGENGGGAAPDSAAVDEAEEARGQSTLPERFRYLTKEAPDRPVRWPWFIALFFIVYAWRTVLWELTNWKKAIEAILHFFGYLFKLALAFIFRFIGDPITGLIRCIEFFLYCVRYTYNSIVAFAPVPELVRIIFFSSTVLAIAEATVPDAVNSQPYLLTLAGVIGFGAVKGFVPELPFWLLLAGLFGYSRLVKKKDGVSAALPSAALLAAVGEPWVRALAIGSYLALAITQNSKSSQGSERREIPISGRGLPVPLLLVAVAIGIHVAAKWVRYRHLTWMIA